ncbi:hypothetical protein [Bacillus sp. FJAT-22090]|uniref:hypothetical protein n=1 Tax=Bacillus sp. FJAT-22090 TaxID=1581038 RepID=UPI0011A31341|nr:hypothetical protein [Bacillus sp. FJAT-22090]
MKYICSNYDNFGKCVRIPIEEEYLVELIENRLNVKVDRQAIEEHIELIKIEDAHLFEILIKDQESILFSRNGIRY